MRDGVLLELRQHTVIIDETHDVRTATNRIQSGLNTTLNADHRNVVYNVRNVHNTPPIVGEGESIDSLGDKHLTTMFSYTINNYLGYHANTSRKHVQRPRLDCVNPAA